MKDYYFTRIETIKSIQVIRAESKEKAQKQLEVEGFDESCDEIISSETEVEEGRWILNWLKVKKIFY